MSLPVNGGYPSTSLSLCKKKKRKRLLEREGSLVNPLNVSPTMRAGLFCDGLETLSGIMGVSWVTNTGRVQTFK